MIWPLEGSHYLMKTIAPVLPITGPVRALLAVTAKGWSFDSEVVYMGILSIIGWSAAIVIAIFIISRINKDLWVVRK